MNGSPVVRPSLTTKNCFLGSGLWMLLGEHAGVLTAVKDKAHHRTRAYGPP